MPRQKTVAFKMRMGTSGGSAQVTSFGKKVLALYQSMERKSASAASPDGRRLLIGQRVSDVKTKALGLLLVLCGAISLSAAELTVHAAASVADAWLGTR